MIESIEHILGTCGESHINIYTLIVISILVGLIKYKTYKK
tara:strand:- start:658 stop:777 length:120 start_codon:yes stop_codon:yes gene_type:complete